eukprot:TRINITY_DN1932_c0_g1_i1.p1 TRINITY_DN1932_c0_g1~~TRINITY_DN1932_c0_g1_i1.p1  ORF type:complete len:461 (-),score=90.26 TRINITY_DN1932_c0_g1_i1:419-1687(-)
MTDEFDEDFPFDQNTTIISKGILEPAPTYQIVEIKSPAFDRASRPPSGKSEKLEDTTQVASNASRSDSSRPTLLTIGAKSGSVAVTFSKRDKQDIVALLAEHKDLLHSQLRSESTAGNTSATPRARSRSPRNNDGAEGVSGSPMKFQRSHSQNSMDILVTQEVDCIQENDTVIYRNSTGELAILDINNNPDKNSTGSGQSGKREAERNGGCLPMGMSSSSSDKAFNDSMMDMRKNDDMKKTGSFKRLIFLLQSSVRFFQPKIAHSHSTTSLPTSPSSKRKTMAPSRVFGATINNCVKNQEKKYDDSAFVPNVIHEIIRALLPHVSQEGIFRVTGSTARINDIVDKIERGDDVDLKVNDQDDIHVLTSLLTRYFRDLPDPLLTFDLHRAFLDTQSQSQSKQMQLVTHSVRFYLSYRKVRPATV